MYCNQHATCKLALIIMWISVFFSVLFTLLFLLRRMVHESILVRQLHQANTQRHSVMSK